MYLQSTRLVHILCDKENGTPSKTRNHSEILASNVLYCEIFSNYLFLVLFLLQKHCLLCLYWEEVSLSPWEKIIGLQEDGIPFLDVSNRNGRHDLHPWYFKFGMTGQQSKGNVVEVLILVTIGQRFSPRLLYHGPTKCSPKNGWKDENLILPKTWVNKEWWYRLQFYM